MKYTATILASLASLASIALGTESDVDISQKEVEVVIKIFMIDYADTYYGYDASVIAADPTATTMTLGYPQSYLDYYATAYGDDYYYESYAIPSITVTQGDSVMIAQVTDTPYTSYISCDITGTTEATCHETYMSSSRNGKGVYTRISETTYGEDDVESGFLPVTVTAGVDKVLAAEDGQTATGAAPSQTAGSSETTGVTRSVSGSPTDGQLGPTSDSHFVPGPTPVPTGAAAANMIQGGAVAGAAAIIAALVL